MGPLFPFVLLALHGFLLCASSSVDVEQFGGEKRVERAEGPGPQTRAKNNGTGEVELTTRKPEMVDGAFVRKEVQNSGVVIKIGHIGAQGAMPNGDRVLEISRLALLDEGILGPELDFDIQSVAACGDSYEGVAVAAAMYHKEKVRAFLGPYCASEFEAVAKMCSFWNIPAISYMPTSTGVSDRNIYKTLARISSKNTNSIAKALIRLVEHYGWRKIAIVTNTGPVAYERVTAFEEEFRRMGTVQVVKKVVLDEAWEAGDMARSGLLAELAANARGK